MNIQEQRKEVEMLCDLKDMLYKEASFYSDHRMSIPGRIYEGIKEIDKKLKPIQNINTMRHKDFIGFANGDFGFI